MKCSVNTQQTKALPKARGLERTFLNPLPKVYMYSFTNAGALVVSSIYPLTCLVNKIASKAMEEEETIHFVEKR